MVDNQHKQIKGYRDLSQSEIDLMNEVKQAEVTLGELWRKVGAIEAQGDRAHPHACDPRWHAVAKTHFEEGFSALVRSIARPVERF
jgi:hypothetical protein